jgi:hypothetical protein
MGKKLAENLWVVLLGIVGSVASVFGVYWIFFEPKPAPAPGQSVKVSGQGIGVVAGRDVNVTVNPKQPEPAKPKLPASVAGETEYAKLASPAFNQRLVGTVVVFRAMFLSEWPLILAYQQSGIPTDNLIFLNHRAIEYGATTSPLGSSDNAFPSFPLSIPANQAEKVYGLHRGDFILVTGQVEVPSFTHLPAGVRYDYARIYVRASEIRKLD